MSFGDLIYNTGNSDPVLKNQTVDDFGTVVREIYYVKTKLNSRPAFPIKWSTGSNQAVSLIGKKISNFEAEAYVLNNTSSTVPLSDGALASLYVIGNDLYPSGTMEYSTDTSSEYANKEPVIFESRWLQSEYDVKNLAEFIKTKAINKGKIIEIETFGNPMLSVGDIVSVKYAYQNLQETQKMIITNVSQSFMEGISTSITCRTL
jgi:cystathionine beta-lyase/cystathionine gamma-synthase